MFLDKLINKYRITASARRSKLTILIDENVETLRESLIDSGFKVIVLRKSLDDPEIQQLAQGTAILTKNTKDFIQNAVRFDYDVIGIEDIKFIDKEQTRKNNTAKKISNAVRKSQFYNYRGNFLLKIYDTGKYEVTELK